MDKRLKKILDRVKLDGSKTWVFDRENELRFASSNADRRDTITVIAFPRSETEKVSPLSYAQEIYDNPELFGIVDVDPITWNIQVGDTFHGILIQDFSRNETLQMVIEILTRDVNLEENPYNWVIVRLVDYAS